MLTLTVNSVGYSFPSTGDQPPWGDGITNWASAVTTGMLQKAGGAFSLTADVNFGGSFGLVSAYFTSRTANAASAGAIRLAKTDVINFRNNANGGNLSLGINGTDQLTFNSSLLLTTTGTIAASKALVSDGSGSIISHASTTATQIGYLAAAGSNVHGDTDAATLTNKTLTSPTINSPTLNTPTLNGSGGALTLPAGPDTLVARATTDTLTNKTIAAGSNTISGLGASNFATQSANTILAGPTSGSAATPTFRALTSADMPSTRNFLINSNFDLWQRGTSITGIANGSSTYGPDRWYAKNSLGTNGVLRIDQTTGVTAGSLYGCQVKISTAPTAAQANGCELYQTLENSDSIILYNQTASFSVQVKSLNNVNQVGVQFFYKTTEAKVDTAIGSEQTFTVNSSTFTTCSISGQALGTSQTTSGVVGVRIRITGVSSGNTYGLNNGFIVEQAMLNKGSTPAPWQRAGISIADELMLCQRYYQIAGFGASGEWFSTTQCSLGGTFPVCLRTSPTATSIASTVITDVGVGNKTSSSPAVGGTFGNSGYNAVLAGFSGATSGHFAIAVSDWLLCDAEI